ncbi:MAG TPA: NAD-dependent epimerase/dehydratase family protein [Longimicrobium sp.]|nr:NAD-dependent epimerase/dehydratase family protein [Longimicrobium sp.]
MRIVVTGGNGLIGAEVCRLAVEAGWEVAAVARRGRGGVRGAWAERVTWVAADVFRPEEWRAHLEGTDAVVHCVGIAFEDRARGVTFERMNGEAAVVALEEAERAGVGAFVYLSASAKPPFLREAYLTAKRAAEERILAARPRGVALRPGLVYGPARPAVYFPALLVRLGTVLPVVGATARAARPLHVETVARASLRAAADGGVRGVVDIAAIERLGRAAPIPA